MSIPQPRKTSREEEDSTRVRMNDDAQLYKRSSMMQTRDALHLLGQYARKMKWNNNNDRILDVGCANGYLTSIMKQYIPDNFEILVGCDINEKMVQYANQHHRDKRTKFKVLDIEGTIPDKIRENFDHVFSFNTLHWIQKQEKAFTNIFNILSRDGDCLLAFIGHMPVYSVFKALSQTEKWGSWLQAYNNFESPYHDIQEPAEHVETMMKRIGFQNVDVRIKQMKYDSYNVNGLKNLVAAINPFKIPKEQFDDFLSDYVTVAREMRLVTPSHDNIQPDGVTLLYNIIVVYATKSADIINRLTDK